MRVLDALAHADCAIAAAPGDRHGQGGARTASSSRRSTARGCGPSRRRRRSAARRWRRALAVDAAILARATDDAWLVERAGGTVRVVESSPANFKVTTPARPRALRRRCILPRAMLTDYHVHLRPDDPGTTAEQYFTPGNAERYREVATERGVQELGVSEHVHRFTAALDVWQHPFWRANAVDDLDAYVELRARADRPQARDRGRLHQRPRGPDGEPARGARLGLRARLGALPRRSRGRLGRRARRRLALRELRRADLAALLRGGRASRRCAGSSTSSATPTWSRSGAPRGRCRRRTRGSSTSRRSRRCSRAAWRWRSPPPGCASRSARSIPRGRSWRWRSTRASRSRCSSDAHRPEHLGLRLREGGRVAHRLRREGDRGVRAPRSGGWSRSDEVRARHRHASLRLRAQADPRRRRDPVRARADRPLRRRRARPRDHRRDPRRGRAGRHRPALPGHRPAVAGRGLDRAAARRGRARARGGLAGRVRRRDRDARAPEARPLPRGDHGAARARRSARRCT